ncbi:rhodanese-like domain-containing protein [candidate division CSSED10-310 bacterium]|uniref:Rhodanese-like domain-containing protein n=1 Tax=candidate division CSSED10-310 bacterium TaxID=2855610 RepID=A0ABV6Z4K1_UNCC1
MNDNTKTVDTDIILTGKNSAPIVTSLHNAGPGSNRKSWPLCETLFLCLILLLVAGCQQGLGVILGVSEIKTEQLFPQLEQKIPLLVVDIRSKKSYGSGHIPGAVFLPSTEAPNYFSHLSHSDVLAIVVVCHSGTSSLPVAAMAQSYSGKKAYSLRGGMTAWQKHGLPIELGVTGAPATEMLEPPQIPLGWWEQIVVILSGFVIKPAYMILSLLIILILWGQRSRDLVLIRWAMIAFLLGETFCAATYLFAAGDCDPMELMHGLGMVGLSAFLPWGIFVLLDARILRFTEHNSRCTLQRLCQYCWKYDDVSCGLQRLFLFAAPALALIALIPLTAPLEATNVMLDIFGTKTHFRFSFPVLMCEIRLYPVTAAALMLLTLLPLSRGLKSIEKAQIPFFLGLGFMLYSLFRFFLLTGFRDLPHWVNFWEEFTELLTIIGLLLLLYVFRRQLGLPDWFRTRKGEQ